jgi:Retrotransposon gag protein
MVNEENTPMQDSIPDPQQQQQESPPMTPEQQLQALIEEVKRLNQIVSEQEDRLNNHRRKEKGEIVKPKRPDDYDGNPKDREKYFNQVETYFGNFDITLADHEDKVYFAAGCLIGAGEQWFRPYMKDYNGHSWKNMTKETQTMFEDYQNYKEALTKAFGTTNERQEAEKELQAMKQTGPLYEDTATFIRLLQKVNWTEESKKERYYNMCKPEVKDELYKLDRDEISFAKFHEEAVKIDNRQHSRRKEKRAEKSGHAPKFHPKYNANQGKKREHIASSNDGRPGKMDLDSINYKNKNFKGNRNKKFTGNCHYCGKANHKEKDCYTKKNKEGRATPEKSSQPEKAQVNTIRENTHANLSWTACYDDKCTIHKSSKEGSGYYPKRPQEAKTVKKARIDMMRFRENSDGLYIPDDYYECNVCDSKDVKHECFGCPECGSMDPKHECEAEWRHNMNAMAELFEEEEAEAKAYFESLKCPECGLTEPNLDCELEWQTNGSVLKELADKDDDEYWEAMKCPLCESIDIYHECPGCTFCKCKIREHDCEIEARRKGILRPFSPGTEQGCTIPKEGSGNIQ